MTIRHVVMVTEESSRQKCRMDIASDSFRGELNWLNSSILLITPRVAYCHPVQRCLEQKLEFLCISNEITNKWKSRWEFRVIEWGIATKSKIHSFSKKGLNFQIECSFWFQMNSSVLVSDSLNWSISAAEDAAGSTAQHNGCLDWVKKNSFNSILFIHVEINFVFCNSLSVLLAFQVFIRLEKSARWMHL